MNAAPDQPARSVCAVPRCDHPTHLHVVCWSCLDGLRRDLRELLPRTETRIGHTGEVEGPRHQRTLLLEPQEVLEPGLLAELQATLTRQDVTGGEHIPEPPEEARTGDGPPAASTVLPFRPMASDVAQYMHETLEHWTRHLLDALGIAEADAIAPTRTRDARTLELAAWLARHPDGIGSDPEAGALVENVRWAIEDVRRVVFPRQLAYVGPCSDECGEQLYAPAGAEYVRCRACRHRWVIADRVAQLRERAEGTKLSAEDMSRALPRLAADIAMQPLTASQIRGHGYRGRLTRYPDPDPKCPDPRYKVAEVIELMRTLALEEQERQARRARATSATTHTRMVAAHERFRQALRAG